MPTSTAATTTRASSPAANPSILIGTRSVVVRTPKLRELHVERERARLAVDREPLHANGAAGHALGFRVERPAQRRNHIGAIAPVFADIELDAGGAGLHVLGDGCHKPIADDIERDFARGARGDCDHHRLAGLIFRLVERDFEHVGRVGGCLRVPAGIE